MSEIGAALTGIGLLVMIRFPFALPLLLLRSGHELSHPDDITY